MINHGFTFDLRRFVWVIGADSEAEGKAAIPVKSLFNRNNTINKHLNRFNGKKES